METEGSEADCVKQGDPGLRRGRLCMGGKRAEEAAEPRPPAGVTALIVAMKPGNEKGCRKMETQCCARKRPRVMPERASYGTARVCAGIQTSERPIGRTPELGAEPRVWTARMLTALDKRV